MHKYHGARYRKYRYRIIIPAIIITIHINAAYVISQKNVNADKFFILRKISILGRLKLPS